MMSVIVCSTCRVSKTCESFGIAKGRKTGRRASCKQCCAASTSKRRKENPQRFSAYNRKNNLMVRYGLTEVEYQEMLSQQNGCCYICQTRSYGRLAVDHCHTTDEVRGLLCFGCNASLGILEKPGFLSRAQIYLGNHYMKKVREAGAKRNATQ